MEVADGVHRFGTRMVNWYLIERDGRLTMIDAGMRGFWPQLTAALRDLGRKVEEVEAVVLTHAHAHLPGHTRGNCALHLADASVVFSGDALVTFDPYRQRKGPRLLIKGVNEDNEQARASLERLAELNARVLLPSHGEPWRDGVAAAVAEARRRGYWCPSSTLTPPLKGASCSSTQSSTIPSGTS
jgi:glyoxylase-like metal-dependent hydrolase (beta-lactamase superfamily II)